MDKQIMTCKHNRILRSKKKKITSTHTWMNLKNSVEGKKPDKPDLICIIPFI